MRHLKPSDIKKYVFQALIEDGYKSDITSQLFIHTHRVTKTNIVVKQNAIISGLEVARCAFCLTDRKLHFKKLVKDGDEVQKGTAIAVIEGKTRSVLAAERVALNFLGRLSGIATLTHLFVKKVSPYKIDILDTRKTTPGLRALERYAVRCGGGMNHRFNLSDMVLVKDNHWYAQDSSQRLLEIIKNYQKIKGRKPVEIEVDNLIQFKKVIELGPDMILLDNMSVEEIKKAVQLTRKIPMKKKPILEASGGITINNVKRIAQTGVNRISIGSLTHSAKTVDMSLEII